MSKLNLSTEQLAYFAGFIDGDGSLECQKAMQKGGKTPRFTLRLSFTLATPEPLHTFTTWLEGTQVKVYLPVDERRSPRHRLHIPKSIAVPLLRSCLPYLVLKKPQAKLILAIEAVRLKYSPSRHHLGHPKAQPMPQVAIDKMDALHLQLRALKSNKRPGGPKRG